MRNVILEKCGLTDVLNDFIENESRGLKRNNMLVYLDSSATTPMKSEVIEEMNRVMEKVYGNPSSVYSLGALAKEEIENARKKVAKVIGAKKEEIYFTSSGSEADNLAIIGIARANKSKGNHIITTKIEHKAVLNSCKKLEKEGFEITYLNVDENGRINFSELMNAINERTILISVMAINNEIGTIQDLEQIGKIAKYKGVIFHSDSVQAIGHLNINVKSINIDSLSISAHKFNGPKGVGAVYIKENVKFEPIIYGGHQERGKRAGTENIAGIVGLAKAIELATENITEKNMKVSKIRDYLKQKLLELDKRVKINCDSVYKSSSNLSVCFENINGKDMVLMLDMKGICVSTGSACNSSESSASHVLLATGISEHDAKNTIRFSLSENNTIEEMDYVIECIKEILNK